jgi:hypothetical protein
MLTATGSIGCALSLSPFTLIEQTPSSTLPIVLGTLAIAYQLEEQHTIPTEHAPSLSTLVEHDTPASRRYCHCPLW